MRAGTYPAQQSQVAVWCYHWWAAKPDLEEEKVPFSSWQTLLIRWSYNKRGSANLLWSPWWSAVIRAGVEERAGATSSQRFLHLSTITFSHSPYSLSSYCISLSRQALFYRTPQCHGGWQPPLPLHFHKHYTQYHIPFPTIESPGIWVQRKKKKRAISLTYWNT